MEFNEALTQALARNNGKLTFEQVVDLLPPASQPMVMQKLAAARASKICDMSVHVDKATRKGVITITSPKPATSTPVAGGFQ